jgi:hypothetical protein
MAAPLISKECRSTPQPPRRSVSISSCRYKVRTGLLSRPDRPEAPRGPEPNPAPGRRPRLPCSSLATGGSSSPGAARLFSERGGKPNPAHETRESMASTLHPTPTTCPICGKLAEKLPKTADQSDLNCSGPCGRYAICGTDEAILAHHPLDDREKGALRSLVCTIRS